MPAANTTGLFAVLAACLLDPALVQEVRIGVIDFYGLGGVPETAVRAAVGIREGETIGEDAIEARLEAAKRRLSNVPAVREAHLELVCCEQAGAILYVGIERHGAPRLAFRDPPRGARRLSPELLALDDEFSAALWDAVRRGEAGEDRSQGHSLLHDPAARRLQERMAAYAATHVAELRDVLRDASDERHRAVAAQALAYAPDKAAIVGDLLFATTDPDENVRNNATRALGVLAEFASSPPRAIRIPAEPLVRLLRSPVWTDRNKAALALAALTQSRDPGLLRQLHEEALDPLTDMARWKSEGHATYALFILGRIGGLAEAAIADALRRGDREAVIRAATAAR